MPKIHKWLEVSFPSSESRRVLLSWVSFRLLLFASRHQVRTPEEMGALACLYMEGKPLLLFLAVYNGPVEVGQQKFGEILESESRFRFFLSNLRLICSLLSSLQLPSRGRI